MKQLATAKEVNEFVRRTVEKLTVEELTYLFGAFLRWVIDVGIDQALPLGHFLRDLGMSEQDIADYNRLGEGDDNEATD